MELIKEYPNVLEPDFCNELIDIFENDDAKYQGVMEGGIDTNMKNTFDLHFKHCTHPNIKKYDDILFTILNKHLQEYIHSFINTGTADKAFSDAGFQIQRYVKNTGFYIYHTDHHIDYENRKSRMITYIFYLNTIEEGGETEFFGTTKIKAEQGKLVLFPAVWCIPHKGCMPISEDKYIATGWLYVHD